MLERAPNLTSTCVLLYHKIAAVLGKKGSETHAYASIKWFSDELRKGRSTISRSLERLHEEGWIYYLPGAGQRGNFIQLIWKQDFGDVRPIQNDSVNESKRVDLNKEEADTKRGMMTEETSEMQEALSEFGTISHEEESEIIKEAVDCIPTATIPEIIQAARQTVSKYRPRSIAAYLKKAIAHQIFLLRTSPPGKQSRKKQKTATVFRDKSEQQQELDNLAKEHKLIDEYLDSLPPDQLDALRLEARCVALDIWGNCKDLEIWVETQLRNLVKERLGKT